LRPNPRFWTTNAVPGPKYTGILAKILIDFRFFQAIRFFRDHSFLLNKGLFASRRRWYPLAPRFFLILLADCAIVNSLGNGAQLSEGG